MRLLSILATVLVAANAYKVEKITGIDGFVRQVEFDPYGNTYVIVENEDDTSSIYKLDRDNNIIFNTQSPVDGNLVSTSQGDVYLIDVFSHTSKTNLYLLKANTTDFQILLQYNANEHSCDTWNFMDKDDNLYVSLENGLAMLKPGQNTLTPIANMENYAMCQHAEDGDGNSYFTNNPSVRENVIYVLTKEAKKQSVPQAQIVSGLEDLHNPFLHPGYNNKVFALFRDGDAFEIRSLNGNSSERLYSSQRDDDYVERFASNGRFFLLGDDEVDNSNYIYIFSPDGSVVKSENSIDYDKDVNSPIPVWRDTAYWYFGTRTESGDLEFKVLSIRSDEFKIRIPNFTFDYITQITADVDDNLWVVANGLYVYLKATDEVVQVSDLPLSAPSEVIPVLRYKESGSLIIGTKDGLYICTDE